jgi:2',3'-cyclic-nucleotide 2'-phosphodiesterase (5'-nucleotidase family)
MRKTISIILGLAIVLWLAPPAPTFAQRIVSLQSLAHGTGTLVTDGDEYKITGVLVILRENGEAEFTLFTDMQLYGQGQWSAGKDLSQGIDLKITGGVFKSEKDAKGTGKLFLRADGKSIATLAMQGTSNTGGKFAVSFVAEDKKEAQP